MLPRDPVFYMRKTSLQMSQMALVSREISAVVVKKLGRDQQDRLGSCYALDPCLDVRRADEKRSEDSHLNLRIKDSGKFFGSWTLMILFSTLATTRW